MSDRPKCRICGEDVFSGNLSTMVRTPTGETPVHIACLAGKPKPKLRIVEKPDK